MTRYQSVGLLTTLAVAFVVASVLWTRYEWPGAAGTSKPTTSTPSAALAQTDASSAPRWPRQVHRAIEAWEGLIAANFAGDQACAECHAEEYRAHLRSGHSRTATLMVDSALATRLADAGSYRDPQRDQVFQFESADDRFNVRDPVHAPGVTVPVTWLLGSGTHAQTPIAIDERTQSGVELRWSYFAHNDTVGVTPDHTRFDEFHAGSIECFGRPMDGADIRACLGCHSTVMPPPSLPIQHSLVVANVGCERCHGPRKTHVDLAHRGQAELAKPMLQYASATAYMDACSDCHRDESSVHPDAAAHERVRFQPYGLKRSRCYLETPGHMTCSTCHDPHDTVSRDRSLSI
ncbi:MAG: multiheme c-type cytochrome, partial [Novipirellula sp. JB048]